jgi:hypothetical protein
MAYGSVLTDVVQSSVTGSPPQFNDGTGTQVGTLCRAWVNFNGVSGSVAIRASFNVSSITYNGTGDYTVNFTNAMTDTNYSVSGSARYNGTSDSTAVRYLGISSASTLASTMATTSVRVAVAYVNGTLQDPNVACVVIHR